MWVCKRDVSKECKGNYKDCTDCILDKIKAEFEDLDRFYDNDYFSGNNDAMFKCNEVIEILDKYKLERSDAE